MFLSITEAAKKAKVSRSHLYVLKKQGKLSFVTNEKGQQGIDLSELARLFPKVMSSPVFLKTSPETEKKTDNDTSEQQINTALLNQKIEYLQEKVSFLERQLEFEQDRNAKLMETLQHQTKYLLPKTAEPSRSFWKKWKT